ncbi:GGDEF domain-containing protein [Varunaivibrio sulfuroxidans]|uniref:diguanylate cyclase n=1 Tax=Varunaivibrio sulfuroxidans TaxID=1773489 RepID=A0A4R3JGT0_9PROT|nr:GGDEF domain-containing protein [Varunaivibrio sulfuroxidans]TCS65127.1 diguanylate cyclase (GGDEF)-like protein [Varunaivibrio sulfuroxidans]WES29587.1 GGDEF domain-containing protein [Varunaivibrio sulfuroxidans]
MMAFVKKHVYGFILLLIAIFIVGLVINYIKARRVDNEINNNIRASLLTISQAENEYLRFLYTLEAYAYQRPETTHEKVVLRMEILWSRLPILLYGDSTKPIRGLKSLAGTVRHVMTTIERIEPLVMALKPGDLATYKNIRAEVDPLYQPVHKLLLNAYLWDSQVGSYGETMRRTVLTQEALSLLGVLLLGAVLIALLFREVHNRKALEEELRHQANTDPLTNANNRRFFLNLSEREYLRVRRYGRPLATLMLDIDHFKNINDVHGHAVGDEVLKQCVRTCLRLLRAGDILGRMGGEEFAVTLPEEGLEKAETIAERLREGIEKMEISGPGGIIRITVSIGLTQANPITDSNFEDVLYRADQALYDAKRAGRNCVSAL